MSWVSGIERSRVVELCNALIAAGARIIDVCDGHHDYSVWFEHERAGDEDFRVEITKGADEAKDYAAKKEFWDRQYKESDDALRKLSAAVDNVCVEAEDGETLADALVRYVVDRYVKTDAAWQEIHKDRDAG